MKKTNIKTRIIATILASICILSSFMALSAINVSAAGSESSKSTSADKANATDDKDNGVYIEEVSPGKYLIGIQYVYFYYSHSSGIEFIHPEVLTSVTIESKGPGEMLLTTNYDTFLLKFHDDGPPEIQKTEPEPYNPWQIA